MLRVAIFCAPWEAWVALSNATVNNSLLLSSVTCCCSKVLHGVLLPNFSEFGARSQMVQLTLSSAEVNIWYSTLAERIIINLKAILNYTVVQIKIRKEVFPSLSSTKPIESVRRKRQLSKTLQDDDDDDDLCSSIKASKDF